MFGIEEIVFGKLVEASKVAQASLPITGAAILRILIFALVVAVIGILIAIINFVVKTIRNKKMSNSNPEAVEGESEVADAASEESEASEGSETGETESSESAESFESDVDETEVFHEDPDSDEK